MWRLKDTSHWCAFGFHSLSPSAESFPLDPNEFLRLKSIEDLQVSRHLPNAIVDRITAFAYERFHVPICLVALIEVDHQLIRSRQGRDDTEMPRGTSFCTHTILASTVFVVPDARMDDRFPAAAVAIAAR
jgi:hypothetical protein